MSIQLIQKYYAEVEKLIRYGGSRNESSLRRICTVSVDTVKIVREMPE
jgi:hypothetical protein